jgi:hypothetical protein
LLIQDLVPGAAVAGLFELVEHIESAFTSNIPENLLPCTVGIGDSEILSSKENRVGHYFKQGVELAALGLEFRGAFFDNFFQFSSPPAQQLLEFSLLGLVDKGLDASDLLAVMNQLVNVLAEMDSCAGFGVNDKLAPMTGLRIRGSKSPQPVPHPIPSRKVQCLPIASSVA